MRSIVLVLDDVLPPAMVGDGTPCQAFVACEGAGSPAEPVVVFDLRVAEYAIGGVAWARDALLPWLETAERLVVPSGVDVRLPPEWPEVPVQEGPMEVASLGDLAPGILGGGLRILDVAGRFGASLPGRWVDPAGGDALRARLLAYRAMLDEVFGDAVPMEALTVHLEGSGVVLDVARCRDLRAALAETGFVVGRLLTDRWAPSALAEWMRFALKASAHGHPVTLGSVDDGSPWVRAAMARLKGGVQGEVVADIRSAWASMDDPTVPALEAERLIRLLDDAARSATLRAVLDQPHETAAPLAAARRLLGPDKDWVAARERLSDLEVPKIVMVPTWQCELRCVYCTVPKQDGRETPVEVIERGIELLLSSDADEVLLHFFGGEPLLNFPAVQHALQYGTARAQALGRRMVFQITTNAWNATDDILDWLADYPVRFQLSLDGDAETQRTMRRPWHKVKGDSWLRSAANRASAFYERGFEVETIMVVHKSNVDRMVENFWAIADMGYRRIQVNFAYNTIWSDEARQGFARGLFTLGQQLRARWAAGDREVQLVNLEETLLEVRANGELTVDFDGQVYGSTSFLYTPALAEGQRVGHLDDLTGFDRYALDGFDTTHLEQWALKDRSRQNNLRVGEVVTTFVRWMHAQGALGPLEAHG